MNETPAITTVSAKDISAAAKACKAHSQAASAASEAESGKKAAMMKLLEPLLGIKSWDELAAMSPDKIKRVARQRVNVGLVELEGIELDALLEAIVKSQERRNVSWKDQYIAELGESAATRIIDDTDPSYSYKIVEAR